MQTRFIQSRPALSYDPRAMNCSDVITAVAIHLAPARVSTWVCHLNAVALMHAPSLVASMCWRVDVPFECGGRNGRVHVLVLRYDASMLSLHVHNRVNATCRIERSKRYA